MGRLIIIVGASGTGKTTLAHALAQVHPFQTAYEQHKERPFQALFKKDARYALANQVDYLLFRAEQERELRATTQDALVDGGLDLDFHGFTRLFHARGLLNDSEFDLCRRLYGLLRGPFTSGLPGPDAMTSDTSEKTARSTRPEGLLPPPDLVIALSASGEIIRERLASRDRINIASGEDAELFNSFLDEWLETLPSAKLLRLDVSHEGPEYPVSIPIILSRL